jgi:uncharacterized protein YggT (Ycf19 family)
LFREAHRDLDLVCSPTAAGLGNSCFSFPIYLNQMPYSLIAWPTEPFLRPTRKLIPSFGGVDITPFIWLAILAFVREILLGQQGILTMFTRLQG